MANTLKLIAGAVSAYASCGFTLADFNSLANNSWIKADSDLDNTTNLDPIGEISFEFTVGGTTTAGAYVGLWAMPLNRTATIYGDNQGEGATLPGNTYFIYPCSVAVGITSGNKIYGSFPPFLLRRRLYRLGISNHTGVSLNAAAAAQVDFASSSYNLNG